MFAWAGATLFVASLSYFVYSYAITWGRSLPPDSGGTAPLLSAAAWNVAWFSLFAVHHSVFARDAVRQRVLRLVGASRERAFYVWVASALFMAVCAVWRPIGGTIWQVDHPGRAALWGLQALGVWLTLRSAAIIDIWTLSGIEQARAAKTQAERAVEVSGVPATQFSAAGPYGWVRHPIYTGWFLLVFAVGTMTMTRLVFAVVSCVYLLLAIPLEERSLRATSAGAYEEYVRRVRWRLFPGIY